MSIMADIWRKRLAEMLLELSYKEGDFTLSSGRKSNYYFDAIITALHPEGAYAIGTLFLQLQNQVEFDGVGGLTLGADPLVTAVTICSFEECGCPGLLVRKEPKKHGMSEQYVEGLANFTPGQKILVLDDVATTGGSALKAAQRIKEAGLEIAGIAVILDREEGAQERIEAEGYKFFSLFTASELKEQFKQKNKPSC